MSIEHGMYNKQTTHAYFVPYHGLGQPPCALPLDVAKPKYDFILAARHKKQKGLVGQSEQVYEAQHRRQRAEREWRAGDASRGHRGGTQRLGMTDGTEQATQPECLPSEARLRHTQPCLLTTTSHPTTPSPPYSSVSRLYSLDSRVTSQCSAVPPCTRCI